jgi:iron complex transport system substrate-binding protein
LLTISDAHLIGNVIEACGGRNVFGDLPLVAAQVDVEAVLKADPDVIVASGMAQERPEWLDAWRAWPNVRAVKFGHLYSIPPDILQRASPRILDGMEAMCRALDQARR